MKSVAFNLTIVILLLAGWSQESYGYNGIVTDKCVEYMGDGWFWHYWMYTGWKPPIQLSHRKKIKVGNNPFLSTTSTVDVSTGFTSYYSVRLTSFVDPGTYTHLTSSSGQMTSSRGTCALTFATRLREIYIAENLEQIKKEMAEGRGEHLKVVAFYSLCEPRALGLFSSTLQQNFAGFIGEDGAEVSQTIGNIIESSPKLSFACGGT